VFTPTQVPADHNELVVVLGGGAFMISTIDPKDIAHFEKFMTDILTNNAKGEFCFVNVGLLRCHSAAIQGFYWRAPPAHLTQRAIEVNEKIIALNEKMLGESDSDASWRESLDD
jgi:hypothetical protein